MKILITGAAGFIGKNTCAFLTQQRHTVIPVVRLASQTKIFERNHKDVIVGDLSESSSLETAVKAKPKIVVHLAAMLPTSFMGEENLRVSEINKEIDENVFRFCKDMGIGSVYASTTSVYGLNQNRQKEKESSACNPIGYYAAEKLYGEEMGKEFLGSEGLQFTSLRINAPYGPGQKVQTVLNIFIGRAIQGLPLLYHGSGSRQQDFIYVNDIAEAITLAAERGQSGLFNISGGRPISVKQLAELVIRSVPGSRSLIKPSGQEDPQEGRTALFSIEKAKKELGWIPKSSLESGIKKCLLVKPGGKR